MFSNIVLWVAYSICAQTGFMCGAPDASVIQRAYENESMAGGALHDRGLRVLSAWCGHGSAPGYLYEVTFTSAADASKRLYFDVIKVVRTEAGWQLASGLCKR